MRAQVCLQTLLYKTGWSPKWRKEMICRNEITCYFCLMKNKEFRKIDYFWCLIIYKRRLNNKIIAFTMKARCWNRLFIICGIRSGIVMICYNIMQPLLGSNTEYKNAQHQNCYYIFYGCVLIHDNLLPRCKCRVLK